MHPNGDSFHSSWPLSEPPFGTYPAFPNSFSSSTLAIRLRSKPRRSSVPQRPVGLSLCRSLKASRKKSAAPGPTTLCAPGERIGEGRMSLALPRCLPKSTRWLHHPAMGKHSDQREPNPKSAGVVRRIANSEHCLCVSNPRCLRICWKVTSSCQRITNQLRIFCGAAPRSPHRRAWVLNSARGSRMRTQRTGTANKPVEYHTAVLEAISIVRSRSSWRS